MKTFAPALAACLFASCLISVARGQGEGETDGTAAADAARFAELSQADWTEAFFDSGAGDWREKWTLDGREATVENDADGMTFKAGPEAFQNAHHAVLWTKRDFAGDLRIEYEYTRLDEATKMVTILYIQATGCDQQGYGKDIADWADKRVVPTMRNYYAHMNAYHVSYAAFGNKNAAPGKDYIRARRYQCGPLGGTELEGEYKNTGLFKTGVPHQITVIKRDREIFMHVRNAEDELLCRFVNTEFPPIVEGRIGLRHMSTRAARYRNFKVSVLADASEPPAAAGAQIAAKALAAAGGKEKAFIRYRFADRLRVTKDEEVLADPKLDEKRPRVSVIDAPKLWWLKKKNDWVERGKEPAKGLAYGWTLGVLADPEASFEALPAEAADEATPEAPADTIGLRVTGAIEPAMDLYFDRDTMRLVRLEWAKQVCVFSEWKTFDGFRLPTRCVGLQRRSGQPWYVCEIVEVERLEEIPAEIRAANE